MKVLALYLPQFHTFPENDEWWGTGYTEWTAVKKAEPLFKGHIQPRVPLDEKYYDLVKDGVETLKWQAELARKYGIYGFSIYQYWFEGKQLMEKPMEILLEHPEIDINYCVCWANETWTRTWYGLENEVLMEQTYGDLEAWEKHFKYLLKFFKDSRYIKIDNKPLLQIYRTFDIQKLAQMRMYFDKRAKQEGFEGIYLVSGKTAGIQDSRKEIIDGYYYFEPGYSLKHGITSGQIRKYNMSVAFNTFINKITKGEKLERKIPIEWIYDAIVSREYKENEIPGIIARWDNTPRRSYKGLMYTGASPDRFKEALEKLSEKVKGRENDFVIVNAMNEWGEGAMLEPDEEEEYGYLTAIKEVVDKEDKA